MWICGNCGETNDGEPGVCATCGRQSRSTEPTRWDPIPPVPQRIARPARHAQSPDLPEGPDTENRAQESLPWESHAHEGRAWESHAHEGRAWEGRAREGQGEERRGLPERRRRREPRNAPGFRAGSPAVPRNAPPAVAAEPWPPALKQPADAAWIPEPAEPPPHRDEGRSLLPAIPIVVLVAALAAAAILGGPRLFDSAGARPEPRAIDQRLGNAAPQSEIPIIPATTGPPPLESGTTERGTTEDGTPESGTTERGTREDGTPEDRTPESGTRTLVTIDPAVTNDHADAVAAMLETYFAGINAKDYAKVAEVLDPDGELDPADPEQMARFSDGTATAEDSGVVLRDLTVLANGHLRTDVTFRSRQEPGDGPDNRPAETCTRWRVKYTVTTKPKYRILRAQGSSNPC